MNGAKWVSIHDLSVDEERLQLRTNTDPGHIDRLSGSMKAEGFRDVQPIIAWQKEGRLWVVDGFHRYNAAIKAGLTTVPVRVLPPECTLGDALAFGVQENADHGRQLDYPKDYRKAAQALAKLPEYQYQEAPGMRKNLLGRPSIDAICEALWPNLTERNAARHHPKYQAVIKWLQPKTERYRKISSLRASAGKPLVKSIEDWLGRELTPEEATADNIRKLNEQMVLEKLKAGNEIPDGFALKGTSVMLDEDGKPKLTWVKTDRDKEQQLEMMKTVIDELTKDLPRVEVPPLEVKATNEDLLAVYPVSDHHIGLMAWGEETLEDNWDMGLAENMLKGAMDYLVRGTPNAGTALVLFQGDFMHYDSMESVTPTNRNMLDSDTRYQKMVRVAIRAMRYCIERAAEKHEHVQVIIEIGNHDLSSMAFMMEAMRNIYEDAPRIHIDNSPSHFHYFRFGSNLIGSHHGQGRQAKLADLPQIMANDRPEDWGATEFRVWFTGHVHHDQVKDFRGCRVESLRILAPADAHAANQGYRSKRDMKAIVFHTNYGETARLTVNPKMLTT